MDTFYVTQTERSPLAVLFRGNLRQQDSAAAFAKVQERLQVRRAVTPAVQRTVGND
jgi:hypothetical protein